MELRRYSWISLLLLLLTACQSEPPQLPEPPEGMVVVPAVKQQGKPYPALFMDATEVIVADFAAFIAATDYVTEAEEFGWSGVFDYDSLAFIPVTGANWQYPLGPTQAAAKKQEPVTQVSIRDARAYADWAGKRLPTEEEWLRAASNNGKYQKYPWGEVELPQDRYLGNWWQGPFPIEDYVLDGFPGVAAVRSFPPTELGLYDISGNVWEWTDTQERGQYVIRGGSFLCNNSYCSGFNMQVKQYTPADSGLNHLGFRCVKDI